MVKNLLLASAMAAVAALGAAAADGDYLDRSGWTWSTSSDCTPEEDIKGIDAIHDGDAETVWHSNYHADSSSPERSCPHWVMIDRGSDTTPFYGLSNLPRNLGPNTACTSYLIYVSDSPFGTVPSDSQASIESSLGQAQYSGTWTGDISEKFCVFDKASTARYILFVHLESYSSRSAACAEMNLLTRQGANGNQGDSSTFNALKITNIDGTEHRIAIDGQNLRISMNADAIRLGNSGITVEYSPAEVNQFTFENYVFDENDPFYFGTKTDALTKKTFNLTVEPADGATVGILREVRIFPPAGALPSINPDCKLPVNIRRDNNKWSLDVTGTELASMASETDGCYIIGGFEESKVKDYILTIPAELFIDSEGAFSTALTATWHVTGQEPDPVPDPDPDPDPDEEDSISEVGADIPTITFRLEAGNLIVGGVGSASRVNLVSTSGSIVASAPVSARGVAVIPVGSLPHGFYLLNANRVTLKITL